MSSASDKRKALDAINKLGACLVFPIDNRRDPQSLWYGLHPRTPMRWEWDENGDDRVSRLWFLREQLSRSNEVIYTKWYRGRATFFSLEVFANLLAAMSATRKLPLKSRASRELLEALTDNSPLSTKQLKKVVDLVGKDNEAQYTRAMKELWERGQIVAYGEFDDGAFPSLGIGATSLLFEQLWREAEQIDPEVSVAFLTEKLGEESLFLKQVQKLRLK